MKSISMTICLLILSWAANINVIAQEGDTLEYFQIVEILPTFQGSADSKEFLEYITSEVIFPQEAIRDSFQGRVIVQFLVDSTGTVTDPKPIEAVPPYIEKEVERVFLGSPKWTPGRHEGKNVNVTYILPVNFTMESTSKDESNTVQPTKSQKKKRRRKE